MPFFKTPPKSQPLSKQWEIKAQKCGLRNTIYSVNGNEYIGEWLDNKKHGIGTQTWKQSGSIYEGEWKSGKPNGYGIYSVLLPETNKHMRQYCGEWRDGKKHGYGTHFYRDSAVYEGEWSEGLRSGYGRMLYGNGDVYEGEWMKGASHGQGVIQLANGNWYDGTWKDGKKNGSGKFCYVSRGQLYEGVWVNGIAKCGALSDSGRDEAPTPSKYPFPKVQLLDAALVLKEAKVKAQTLISVDEGDEL